MKYVQTNVLQKTIERFDRTSNADNRNSDLHKINSPGSATVTEYQLDCKIKQCQVGENIDIIKQVGISIGHKSQRNEPQQSE